MMKKLITVLIFFTFLFNGSLLQAKIVKVKGEAVVFSKARKAHKLSH